MTNSTVFFIIKQKTRFKSSGNIGYRYINMSASAPKKPYRSISDSNSTIVTYHPVLNVVLKTCKKHTSHTRQNHPVL